MEYIAIGILFLLSLLLTFPMVRKPLSEDDGNWFYLAVFWKKGVRLYKDSYYVYGYFGIQWIVSKIYNLLGFEKPCFFYYFKAAWYTLNTLSIYWLVLCFWHEPILALVAGMVFAIIIAIPNTLFVLTYGEHFFILPINLSIIFAYYGLSSGNSWYFALAGLMSAWAIQIKPTALLFCFTLPVAFYCVSNVYLPLIVYTVVLIGFNLLPIVVLRRHNKKAQSKYLLSTF